MTTPHTQPEIEGRQQLTQEAISNLAEQMMIRFDALEQNIEILSDGQQRLENRVEDIARHLGVPPRNGTA